MKNLPIYIIMLALSGCGSSSSDSGDSSLQDVAETSAANDSLQDAQLVALGSRISGTLNESTDAIDIYKFSVSEGDAITVSLTGDAGTDFDLYLYTDNYSVSKFSEEDASTESISYTVESGVSSLNVGVEVFEGSGSYQLSVGSSSQSGGNQDGSGSGDLSDLGDMVCIDAVVEGVSYIQDLQGNVSPGTCSGAYVSECRMANSLGGGVSIIHYTAAAVSQWGHDINRENCEAEDGDGVSASYVIL